MDTFIMGKSRVIFFIRSAMCVLSVLVNMILLCNKIEKSRREWLYLLYASNKSWILTSRIPVIMDRSSTNIDYFPFSYWIYLVSSTSRYFIISLVEIFWAIRKDLINSPSFLFFITHPTFRFDTLNTELILRKPNVDCFFYFIYQVITFIFCGI